MFCFSDYVFLRGGAYLMFCVASSVILRGGAYLVFCVEPRDFAIP